MQPAKSPKPGKPRDNIGQFNDTVMGDLAYVRDSKGISHGFLVLVDEGTDWCVCKYIGHGTNIKTAEQLYDYIEECWINWAGPPDVFVADNERGFSAELFVTKLGRAGTLYTPSAAYAPWQKGRVERKIESIKMIIKKTVLQVGIVEQEMRIAGIEAATALNQRPGPNGVSAGMMLFGQKMKLYGELYANGEPLTHPEALNASSELGRRLQIRSITRQAAEEHHAKEMLRKTVAARTRLVENISVGEIVFFYRKYPSSKAQKLQAQRGCYLGPAVIIGKQGQNHWIAFAGRCYLVAPEHVRSLAPDEIASLKPLIRQGLDQLQQASKSKDFVDLSKEEASPEELDLALQQPAGNDFEADDLVPQGSEASGILQPPLNESAEDSSAQPILELQPEEPILPAEQVEEQLSRIIEDHTTGEKRKQEQYDKPDEGSFDLDVAAFGPPAFGDPPIQQELEAATTADEDTPVAWKPLGSKDNLKWERTAASPYITVGNDFVAFGKSRYMTEKVKKKM